MTPWIHLLLLHGHITDLRLVWQLIAPGRSVSPPDGKRRNGRFLQKLAALWTSAGTRNEPVHACAAVCHGPDFADSDTIPGLGARFPTVAPPTPPIEQG